MKRIYFMTGAAAMMLMGASYASAETIDVDDFLFEITSENTCKLTEVFDGYPETLVIPATVTNGGTEYTVTAIGQGAAMNKEELIDVTIPGTVTTIETNAFYGAWKMTTLSIGEGITSIANNAFGGCTGLTSITIHAVKPPTAGNSSFSQTTFSKATLYVPEEAVSAYENHIFFWGDFTKILPIGEEPEEPEPVDPPVDDKSIKLVAMSPANGTQLHAISNFTLMFDLPTTEVDTHMILPVSGKGTLPTIQRGDEEPIHATSINMVEGYPATSVFIRFPYTTEEGEYTLTVPEGCVAKYTSINHQDVIVDGTENKEITAKFTVSSNIPTKFSSYKLSPASGKELASISEIGLSFPQAPYGMNKNENLPIELTCGDTLYTGILGGWGNEDIRITFAKGADRNVTITEPGEYTLKIPAGVFSANYEENDEIVAEYTISEDVEFDYICSPLNLSEETLPDEGQVTISFEFPDATAVDFTPFSDDPEPTFIVKYGGEELQKVNSAMSQRGYQVQIYNGEPTLYLRINQGIFTEPGILVVEAEKGAFKVDGFASPAINYSVNYGDNKRYDFTVSPVIGTKSNDLSKFTVSFPDAEEVEYYPEDAFIVLFMLHNSYTDYTVAEVEDAECPTFEIVFDPAPSVLGEYDFTVGKRSFLIDKYYFNPIITGKYELWDREETVSPEEPKDPDEIQTGVSEAAMEITARDIYTLDGRLILREATPAEIGTLEPGLYISGGKKIIVK